MTAPNDAFVSRAPKLGQVTSMTGIRGFGVTMLLIGHALFGYVESWVTVIDAFFVLSGFLITTLLIQEHDRTGTIGLRPFYWRRGLRLFPSVWLFVGVWLVIGWCIQALVVGRRRTCPTESRLSATSQPTAPRRSATSTTCSSPTGST